MNNSIMDNSSFAKEKVIELHSDGTIPYAFLTSRKMREEILHIGNNLAEYMHTNKIPNIIFMDRSIRPAYLALKNSWKKNYPKEKCPDMYFTNPNGYYDRPGVAVNDADALAKIVNNIDVHAKKSLSRNKITFEFFDAPTDYIANEFNDTYKKLANNKTAPLMLFDVCMHNGTTLEPILKILKHAGYTNLIVGLAQPPKPWATVKADYSALDYQPEKCCYTFGRDESIIKNAESLLSSVNTSEGERLEARVLRREINAIFNGYVRSDFYN